MNDPECQDGILKGQDDVLEGQDGVLEGQEGVQEDSPWNVPADTRIRCSLPRGDVSQLSAKTRQSKKRQLVNEAV